MNSGENLYKPLIDYFAFVFKGQNSIAYKELALKVLNGCSLRRSSGFNNSRWKKCFSTLKSWNFPRLKTAVDMKKVMKSVEKTNFFPKGYLKKLNEHQIKTIKQNKKQGKGKVVASLRYKSKMLVDPEQVKKYEVPVEVEDFGKISDFVWMKIDMFANLGYLRLYLDKKKELNVNLDEKNKLARALNEMGEKRKQLKLKIEEITNNKNYNPVEEKRREKEEKEKSAETSFMNIFAGNDEEASSSGAFDICDYTPTFSNISEKERVRLRKEELVELKKLKKDYEAKLTESKTKFTQLDNDLKKGIRTNKDNLNSMLNEYNDKKEGAFDYLDKMEKTYEATKKSIIDLKAKCAVENKVEDFDLMKDEFYFYMRALRRNVSKNKLQDLTPLVDVIDHCLQIGKPVSINTGYNGCKPAEYGLTRSVWHTILQCVASIFNLRLKNCGKRRKLKKGNEIKDENVGKLGIAVINRINRILEYNGDMLECYNTKLGALATKIPIEEAKKELEKEVEKGLLFFDKIRVLKDLIID